MHKRTLRAVLFCCATLIFVESKAMASAASAPEANPKGTGEANGEIIVTAQKRAQSAQAVGITLSAFTGATLQRRGVVTVPDLAKLTPGVSVAGSFAGQNVTFSIRGVTQQDLSVTAESPIAVYVDDGYLAANNAAGIGLLDIEHVEILKGPQGTLFGRNATGGLVNITSRRPTKDLSINGELSYGSYNDAHAELAVGGPMSDNVQARIAGMYQRNDGWVKNISPTGGNLGGNKTVALRGQIAAQPGGGATNILLAGYYSNIQQSWGPYLLLSTRSVETNGIPNSVIVNSPTLFGEPPSNAKDLVVDANDAQSHGSYNKIFGATMHISTEISGIELTSISDYKENRFRLSLDDDASAISFINDDPTIAKVQNWSQEVRMFKKIGRLRLTTGAYYLGIDSRGDATQELFGLGGGQVENIYSLRTNSYSAFVQGEYALTRSLTFIAGYRGTQEDKSYKYNAINEQIGGAVVSQGRSYRGVSHQWLNSWKAQIEYRPAGGILLFAGYSRGTKAGSFNVPFAGGATPVDSEVPYKPEKLDSFEVGAKTTLLGGLMKLNGSLFYYDYHNYQAFKFINFSSVVTNNPATIKGAEIDLDVRPLAGLDLSLNGSYIDASVKNVSVSNSLASAVENRTPPYTSKWQGVASLRYEFDLRNGQASIGGDAQYRGSYYFSLTNFGATKVDSYVLFNARVAWQTPDTHWEFAVFGRNLGDKRYRTVGFEASDFGGFTQVAYGQPRWVGVSATYRLGK